MNSVVLVLLIFQFLPSPPVNTLWVGGDFTADIQAGTLATEIPGEAGVVLVVPSAPAVLVIAHYGLAGTAFHSFTTGERVSLFDTLGTEHLFRLAHSWSQAGQYVSLSRLEDWDIVFITCLDGAGSGLLFWAGERVR